jgi:hypothetical protein
MFKPSLLEIIKNTNMAETMKQRQMLQQQIWSFS